MGGADLAQHADQGAAAQRFLHGPEQVRVGAALDDDQPGRMDPEKRQTRPVKTSVAPAPERRALIRSALIWGAVFLHPALAVAAFDQPGQQGGAEAAGGDAVVGGDHLVQAGAGQPAPGQGIVECFDAHRERRVLRRAFCLAASTEAVNTGV
jgi:hypothetical protein